MNNIVKLRPGQTISLNDETAYRIRLRLIEILLYQGDVRTPGLFERLFGRLYGYHYELLDQPDLKINIRDPQPYDDDRILAQAVVKQSIRGWWRERQGEIVSMPGTRHDAGRTPPRALFIAM